MGLANYRITEVKDKKGLPKKKAEFTTRKDTMDVGSDGQIIDRWVLSGVDPVISAYSPTPEEQQVIAQARKMYADADVVMRTPRREFNDLSVFTRMQVDQMAFNTYQPNNGDPPLGDNTESWKCLSADSHILTVNGWKGIGEINKGDEVLSYDIETKEIKSDTVRDYFEYEIDGELMSIKSKYSDQLITPNHRVIARKYRKLKREYEGKYKYIEAHDLGSLAYKIPVAGKYDGYWSIGEDMAELLGWILSEGDFDKGSKAINISQSSVNQKKVDTIRELLIKIGVKFTEYSYKKSYKGRKFLEYRFRLSAKDETTKVIRYHLIPNKKPTNKLLHLRFTEKERLLKGLMEGDGYIKDGKYINFAQKDKETLSWFQTLIHLMGKTSVVGERNACVRYSDEAETWRLNRKLVPYKGKVWSISTGRTNYIAKRNGLIFITGNSNAMTPVVRNKCISIAAHICARTIFPKVFAWNEQSEVQEDAAMVMRDLYQWVGDQINYPFFSLKLILTALWSPAAIGEMSYHETTRTAFVPDGKGGITEETDEDEDLSGFMGNVIGADELYISNFYENDIQKQSYLIKRVAKFYDIAKEEYESNPNFEFVRPGMITLFDDANQMFYEVYDSNMRKDMVEEVTIYRRNKNTVWKIVNGVLMTPWNNPNQRQDKRYPFFKTGFEFMDEGQCFYYKSLAFKTQQDANIINTLYPMIIDGTYLSIMPPLLNTTGENIPSSVVIPGASISTSQPNNGKIEPLQVSGVDAGLKVIGTVQESLDDSAPQMELGAHRITAYEMAIREQEAAILLGLFTAMIGDMVKQMGKLMVSDILQYLTIGEATGITGDSKLIYKTFIVQQKGSGKQKHHRIVFDSGLPNEQVSDDDLLKLSMDTLKMQGGLKSSTKLSRVNPSLFRELKYAVVASPDVLNPLSEETERAFKLQIYDTAIQNPRIAQDPDAMDAVTRDFLFGAFPESSHNPDKYMPKKAQPGQPMPQMPPQAPNQPPKPVSSSPSPTGAPSGIPPGMPMK